MRKNLINIIMKSQGTKIGKYAVVVTLMLVLTANLSFGQWAPSGSANLNNIGSWPSVSVVNDNLVFVVGGTAGYGPVIYRSTNGGANFTELPRNGITTSGRFFSCVWGKDANTIFVGDGAPSGDGTVADSKFYKTTNGGTNWTVIGHSGSGVTGFFNGIVFSRSNPLVGFANCDPSGTTGHFLMWKTTNGGVNWTSFTFTAPSAYGAQNSVFCIDANFFGFGLNVANARVAITTNGGTNFNYYSLQGATSSQGFVSTVTFNDDKIHGYAAVSSTNNNIWQTTNGGLTWNVLDVTGVPNNVSGQANIKYVSGTNSAFYVISNTNITYSFRIENNGAVFTPYTSSTSAVNIMHIDAYYSGAKVNGNASVYTISPAGSVYKLQDSPLPVEMASFTYSTSGRNVNLKWITSMEQNNAGFEVYRINDGLDKNTISNWTKVGFVQGKGTVNGNTEYNFTDNGLNTGKYDYRLKQIDYNGNFQFYNLNGLVNIGTPSKISLGQNYPNPFNPVTTIGYEIPQDSKVTMKVYDITGKQITSLVNESQTAGYHTVKFDASGFSSGMYFYKIFVSGANGVNTEITKTMSVVK
ncbi:MAG: T9SS type A sorting domain-containing protein [Ignavibacteria bacterium]|nr:T9SS type A sorting domain-containing protein [Ignavibacteria bacterium]